jgi:hypothetical protein
MAMLFPAMQILNNPSGYFGWLFGGNDPAGASGDTFNDRFNALDADAASAQLAARMRQQSPHVGTPDDNTADRPFGSLAPDIPLPRPRPAAADSTQGLYNTTALSSQHDSVVIAGERHQHLASTISSAAGYVLQPSWSGHQRCLAVTPRHVGRLWRRTQFGHGHWTRRWLCGAVCAANAERRTRRSSIWCVPAMHRTWRNCSLATPPL